MTDHSKPFLTESVKRLTKTNILIFFTLVLLFNSILIIFLNNIYREDLDHRLEHEINIILRSTSFNDESQLIIDSSIYADPNLYSLTDNSYFLQIYNSANQILFASRNLDLYKHIPIPPFKHLNDIYFEKFNYENETFYAAYYPIHNQQGKQIAVLRLTVFDKIESVLLDNLISLNLILIPISLLLLIPFSFLGAKIFFKPINDIITIAQRINQNNLSERIVVEVSPYDELGKLRDTLNNLFDKIETYIGELKNFTDQASHQLMNPLTAIKTEIEYILKSERDKKEYKDALLRLEDQVESMISIVKTLLIIARSEKAKTTSDFVFNFSLLLKKEINEYFYKNHINSDFKLDVQVEDELYLRGESEKFSMVLQNLFSNSKKFSIESIDISIKAYRNNNNIILEVADKGIGIEHKDKNKVFDKFYRTEKAEKLGINGFGLGLNLVKKIVEESSGKIEILDNIPNGTIVKISLPAIELSD